jgi:hypothetical protein
MPSLFKLTGALAAGVLPVSAPAADPRLVSAVRAIGTAIGNSWLMGRGIQ